MDDKILEQMRKTIIFIYISLFCLLAISCEKSVELDFPKAESQIIADGWIEQNKYPKVVVTRSLPYFSEIDSATFRDLVVTKAKVSVTVDNKTEILTLHRNEKYFPPYIYQGFQIKGKVGKTYRLEVSIGDKRLTATTRISKPPSIDSLWTIPHPQLDTLKQIMIQFTDDPKIQNYYRLFSKVKGTDKNYKPSYGSVFADGAFDGATTDYPLFKGYTTSQGKEDLYFSSGDTVYIKFCTMKKESYRFWQSFQQEKANSLNPFANSSQDIEGNVTGDGKGIWTGYGAEYDKIIIP